MNFSTNLKVLLLEVGPEELHELGAGGLLRADDVGQLGAELLRGLDACSGGHGAIWRNLVVLDGGRVEERLSSSLRNENEKRGRGLETAANQDLGTR